MTEDMNKFWQELQKQAADPKGFAQVTDAEAERRMAEAGEEPMSEAEIAAIVSNATGVGPRGVVGEGGSEQEPEARQELREHRDIEAPQARYLMKAAAVVVGILLLVAAGVGTGIIPWPERAGPWVTPRTLTYRDAILIVVDPGEETAVRYDAVGRILPRTLAGIRGLREIHEAEGTLRASANSILQTLLTTVKGSDVSEDWDVSRVHALKHAVQESLEFIKDPSNPMSDRQRRQKELGAQLQLGVLALRETLSQEPVERLEKSLRDSLEHIRRALSQ